MTYGCEPQVVEHQVPLLRANILEQELKSPRRDLQPLGAQKIAASTVGRGQGEDISLSSFLSDAHNL